MLGIPALVLDMCLWAEAVLGIKSREGGVLVRYRLTGVQVALPAFTGGLLGIGAGMFGDWRSGHPVWHAFMWHELAGLLGTCVLLVVLTQCRLA